MLWLQFAYSAPGFNPFLNLLKKILATRAVATFTQIAMAKRRPVSDKDVDARWNRFPLSPATTCAPFVADLDTELWRSTCIVRRVVG
jgi:hypothetical protein